MGPYSGNAGVVGIRSFGVATLVLLSFSLSGPRVRAEIFIRGDANRDAKIDIADPIFMLSYLFDPSVGQVLCPEALDANDDDRIDIADPIYTLSYLFAPFSPPPPPPFPGPGLDPRGLTFGCAEYSDARYYYVLHGGDAPSDPPGGFVDLDTAPPAPDPDSGGAGPALAPTAEAALLSALERIEGQGRPRDTSVVRNVLLPLYIRVLRRLVDTGELESAIRNGVPDEMTDRRLPSLDLEPDPAKQCEDVMGPSAECDPSRWYDPACGEAMCDPLDPDAPPEWEETDGPFVPRPYARAGCFPAEKKKILSEAAVADAMVVARRILTAYDNLVAGGFLADDLPSMEVLGGGPIDDPHPHSPITVNPDFAKEILRRIAPGLAARLAPVAGYLVDAMRAKESPPPGRGKGASYTARKVDLATVLRERPKELLYFNDEPAEWMNEWAFRTRLPRFWLTEKHDPGERAEPYFVKIVGMPTASLSEAGSYGDAYASGRLMAVSGEVTEEYPLKQGERRGLNPPDNFISPYAWTSWSLTYGLPATASAQGWEQDWTRRSDVVEGVRRAAKKAEREVTKKFFDTIMEGLLEELGEQMEEMAKKAFEEFRNEVLRWLRDLMKQKTNAAEVAKYLSELLDVDVSALVAALNFLFDPDADSAMKFMTEAFGQTILAMLAGGPLGFILDALLGVLVEAFERADTFFEFLEGVVGGVIEIVDGVLSFIGDLLAFKDFFRDILAMLNGDDLLGTASISLAGDTGGITFRGWNIDESEYHGEVAEFRGKYDFREHPEKSVVKAQFDIHRMMMYQRGERKYLLAKDVRGIPGDAAYSFTVQTRAVVSVGVTRIDKARPFPQIFLKPDPRGDAYYQTYTGYSRDGYAMAAVIRPRPISYGTKIYVYLRAPGWDQPYAQAGRVFFEGKYMK